MRMNTRDGGCSLGFAVKAFLTLLLLLTMPLPFFIKLISNLRGNGGGDPSPHCKAEHEKTHVKNPDLEEYQGNYN